REAGRRRAFPGLVAAEAFRGVRRLRILRTTVGIVTGGAGHPPGAALEARRLAQPVSLVGDLELPLVSRAGRMIEMPHVRREVIARAEREDSPAEGHEPAPVSAAGGLQMTLHADVELALRRQAGGVQDALAHVDERRG